MGKLHKVKTAAIFIKIAVMSHIQGGCGVAWTSIGHSGCPDPGPNPGNPIK